MAGEKARLDPVAVAGLPEVGSLIGAECLDDADRVQGRQLLRVLDVDPRRRRLLAQGLAFSDGYYRW